MRLLADTRRWPVLSPVHDQYRVTTRFTVGLCSYRAPKLNLCESGLARQRIPLRVPAAAACESLSYNDHYTLHGPDQFLS